MIGGRISSSIALLLLALLLSACGGSDGYNDYVLAADKAVVEAGHVLSTSEAALQELSPFDSGYPARLVPIASQARSSFQRSAEQLAAKKPPTALQAFHEGLVQWLNDAEAAWRTIAEVRRPAEAAFPRAVNRLPELHARLAALEVELLQLDEPRSVISLTDRPEAWNGDSLAANLVRLSFAQEALSSFTSLATPLREAVAAKDWYKDGIDENDGRLLVFLRDSTSNNGSSDRPSLVVPNTDKFQRLDVETQLAIVRQQTYDFVEVDGRKILVVTSGGPRDADRGRRTREIFREVLPGVEAFLGGPFPYNYLHIEIDADFDADLRGLARGVNFYLAPVAVESRGTITHELVHVFQSQMTQRAGVPTWFVEGLADVTRVRVTGERSSAYIAAATGARIRPDLRQLHFSNTDRRDFQTEAGNGYLFLSAILDLIGPQAFANGTHAALGLTPMLLLSSDIFEAYEQHTPPEKLDALRRLYVARVDGYIP
jgi:hypothetical protein